METVDVGHGRGWADAPAAASIARIDTQLGRPLQITEAGRTHDRQAQLRRDYLAKKPGAAFALPPDPPEGPGEHQSGEAIDTDEWVNATVVAVLNDNGWYQTAKARKEPWHFEYFRARDNHLEDDMNAEQDRILKLIHDWIRDTIVDQKIGTGAAVAELNARLNRTPFFGSDPAVPGLIATNEDIRQLEVRLTDLIKSGTREGAMLSALPDADIARLAKATADELARRLTAK